MNSTSKTLSRFALLLGVVVLAVAALSLSSCDKLKDEVLPEAKAISSRADLLHNDFFQKRPLMVKNLTTEDPEYEAFRLEVQSEVIRIIRDLSNCKEQEEADKLLREAGLEEIRKKNDDRKTVLNKAIAGSSTAANIKDFQRRCKDLQQEKGDNYRAMMDILEEEGDDYCEETQEEIKACHRHTEERVKKVLNGLTGFSDILDGAGSYAGKIHTEIESLCQQIEKAHREWTPPPPPPSRPEKILFTVDTTPALYDTLLCTLLQQYKQYTYSYTAPDGLHCIADKANKTGFVIRLVKPSDFDTAWDDLEQHSADLIFAFRDSFSNGVYSKIEKKAADYEDDLNGILISGVAYNAITLKTATENSISRLTSKELPGKAFVTGTPGSLSGELCRNLLTSRGCTVQEVDRPDKHLNSGSIIAVAFSRSVSAGKELPISRTPSEIHDIYFRPNPGNISSGRYPLSSSVNAVFNPSASGNKEARAFIEYVLSDAGQTVVKAADYVSRNEYEETNPEILCLRKMFDKAGYTISRIITYDTFLFPKNDATISRNPIETNGNIDFREFDSTIRSNFGHMAQVLRNTKSTKGHIAVGIIGHASSEGGEAINRPLSVNRAKYTANCIKKCDLEKRRVILTDGMSSSVPVDDNKNEEGRVRNRRCTAYVVEVFETGVQ